MGTKTQQRDTKDSINSTKDSPNGHKRLNKGTQKTQKGRILQKEISVHQKWKLSTHALKKVKWKSALALPRALKMPDIAENLKNWN